MNSKILHIGPKPPNGFGIVSYVEGLVNSSLREKFTFLYLDTKKTGLIKEVWILKIIMIFVYTIKLLKILIKNEISLVHIHTSSGASFWEKSFLGLVCKIHGTKVVYHFHSGDIIHFFNKSIMGSLAKYLITASDKIIVVNKKTGHHFNTMMPNCPVSVIPNGISVKHFKKDIHRNNNSIVQILFAGKLKKEKGVFDILNAIHAIITKTKADNIRMHFIGSGDKQTINEMVRLSEKLNISKLIYIHGPVFGEEKYKYFAISDIFLLPSYNESFGIANLEAMAAEIPVISTNIGAIPEYITHNENGYLISPGDVNKLSEYLERLILNPSQRKIIGKKNRQKVSHQYDWSVIAEKIETIYKSLMD